MHASYIVFIGFVNKTKADREPKSFIPFANT